MRYLLLYKSSFLFCVLMMMLAAPCAAQGFLRADGKRIVNEQGENVLLRGMGLGGWMLQEGYMLRIDKEPEQYRIRQRLEEISTPAETQEFYDTWLENNTRKIDVDSMHAWGFNSIRLPMHYNLYTLPSWKEPVAGKNTWLEKGFAMTDSLLTWCKANHMYLILDLHAAPGGQGNNRSISDRDSTKPSLWSSQADQQKTVALWRKLAERYAKEPNIGGYDLLNETNYGFEDSANDVNGQKEQKNEPLKKLLVEITKAIREVDQKHIVILEGNAWANNYNGLLPPWDKNMVLSFHKYWNFNTPKEIEKMLSYREKYNIPVWIGESGENSNVWYTQAISLFEQNNVGWSWWPWKKIGPNNPLEIRSNLNYLRVADFLNGKGRAPKESDVYSGLLELATYAKLENCIIHYDVIDAMFRQVRSTATMPFKVNRIADKSVIYAVDYDLGRNGFAYYDLDSANYMVSGQNTPGNRGHTYRNDGVDIGKDSAHVDRYFVTDIESNEWLQYTVHALPGTYHFRINVASNNDSGRINVYVNGKQAIANLSIPNTGGTKAWKKLEAGTIKLSSSDKIRVVATGGGFNFYSLEFHK